MAGSLRPVWHQAPGEECGLAAGWLLAYCQDRLAGGNVVAAADSGSTFRSKKDSNSGLAFFENEACHHHASPLSRTSTHIMELHHSEQPLSSELPNRRPDGGYRISPSGHISRHSPPAHGRPALAVPPCPSDDGDAVTNGTAEAYPIYGRADDQVGDASLILEGHKEDAMGGRGALAQQAPIPPRQCVGLAASTVRRPTAPPA